MFIADPLIAFHTVEENDNGAMELLVKEGFGAVAIKTNSAGELSHHTAKLKPGQGETSVEDGRGASAVLYAVRSARVLNFMTPDVADKLGIAEEERRLHIRITNGKANMEATGKIRWIRLAVESLPNGDRVAIAGPWQPTDPFESITTEHMRLAIKLAKDGKYRADVRSPQWIGYALAAPLGLVVQPGKGRSSEKDLAKLKDIINTWIRNEILAVERRNDSEGKLREYVVSGRKSEAQSRFEFKDETPF